MTQASLSPDFDPSMRLDASLGTQGTRVAGSSEAALWLFGLTATTLLGASLLVLGSLALGAVSEAAISGFMSAIALMTGVLGLVAAVYVTTTARRTGYLRPILRSTARSRQQPLEAPPVGMHVVPARPADHARRLRQLRDAERDARNRQAIAIRTAEATRQARRAVSTWPAQAWPTAPAAISVSSMQRPVMPAPAVSPRSIVAAPRPAPSRSAAPAYLHLQAPRVHPRGQAALMQVGAASTHAAMTAMPPRPWPAAPGPHA